MTKPTKPQVAEWFIDGAALASGTRLRRRIRRAMANDFPQETYDGLVSLGRDYLGGTYEGVRALAMQMGAEVMLQRLGHSETSARAESVELLIQRFVDPKTREAKQQAARAWARIRIGGEPYEVVEQETMAVLGISAEEFKLGVGAFDKLFGDSESSHSDQE